jgi:hypothetical protein
MEVIDSPKRRLELVLHGTESQNISLINGFHSSGRRKCRQQALQPTTGKSAYNMDLSSSLLRWTMSSDITHKCLITPSAAAHACEVSDVGDYEDYSNLRCNLFSLLEVYRRFESDFYIQVQKCALERDRATPNIAEMSVFSICAQS